MQSPTQYAAAVCLILIALFTTSCIPQQAKEKLSEELGQVGTMMADDYFKRAIAAIELHKLRTRSYPATLQDLQYLSRMDTVIFQAVAYTRLDSGYELNMTFQFPTNLGGTLNHVELHYPDAFWRGLGCVKSNTRGHGRQHAADSVATGV